MAMLALAGTLAAGGLAAIGLMAASTGHFTTTGADALHAAAVASLPGAGRPDGAATALAGPPAPPVFTFPQGPPSPTGKAEAKPKGRTSAASRAATPKPSAPSAPVPSTSPASAPPSTSPPAPSPSSPSPTPTSPTAPSGGGATACTNPVFTTSTLYGTYTDLPYFVANDMWNVGSSDATQTLSVCSFSSWNVTASMNDGGGGVKTYPNSHMNFDNAPAISSLQSVTSTFAETSPGTGTYEDAYDIWLNGVAIPGEGSDEVMIWTQNNGQTPGGSPTATATFDGRSYTVWKGNGGYVAFVANSTFTSGTLNLLEFFQWLIAKGWVPATSTLSQVDYGVEVVNTNSAPENFQFSNFSVSAS
jgi:outer membrane biosynthesis protein TonB